MDSYEILTQKSIKTGLKIINALDSDELVLSEESYSRLANVKNRIGFFAPFGSFLYGTATENSDFDFKGIYIPYASEFLEDSCQSMRIQPIKQVTRNQSQEILANEKKNVINIKNN